MIEPGQICRLRTCKTFKVGIVLGPSQKGGKLRVCRWQATNEDAGGHWSAPCALFEHQLEPLPADFDLTSRRGQAVAAARRTVVNGLVRWQVSPMMKFGDRLFEVHDVGSVQP